MKRKILALFILTALACLPFKALAYERNFPAGSIIIPMDAFYQPEADGGHLEAYGLAYYLLDHQDPECVAAATSDDERAACEHTVGVSWVINDQKTAIDGIDLVIEDNTLPRTEDGVQTDAVVKLYDHAGGTTSLTFDAANGDNFQQISYRGGIWIIDVQDLADGVEDEVYALINSDSWDAVNVHVAQVPFAAPVFREMRGTPPRIALMNDGEDKTKGNASILESYLRLAGICSSSYEIVTPNEIAGYAAGDYPTKINPILPAKGYDFLWAPHWDGTKNYDGTKGFAPQDKVVEQIQVFLKNGRGLLAECASIETFEHSTKGHFLTDKGFGHNGGTNKAEDILYNNVVVAYTQIGDFTAGFEPEGGHLHNWRPYQIGDPYNLDPEPTANSTYNPTVKRFTIDNTGWDYFVGGYAYGNTDYGYVVYLGGHSYADCKAAKEDTPAEEEIDPEVHIHPVDIEFDKDVKEENFRLFVFYEWNSASYLESVFFEKDGDKLKKLSALGSGTALEIDLTGASVNKKKLLNILFKNTDNTAPITITKIQLNWSDGNKDQKIKKLTDQFTDVDFIKAGSPYTFTKENPPDVASFVMEPVDFIIEQQHTAAGGSVASVGCTNNEGCTYKNIAGVRYVLNTLFNIKYELKSYEYVRSSPIVDHPWLYQGSFQHPSYYGHFRRYDVLDESPNADWDTAERGIKDAKSGNSDGRKVYTAAYDDSTDEWSKINFDAANVDALTAGLDVEPANDDTADEIKVIERLRGRYYDYEESKYKEQPHNKLGGIMHSAPVIVRDGSRDSRFSRKKEVAYVGDIYGMLHAIDTHDGKELWAYIPSNLLGKLQNDRTDPNANSDFAAVDGSPTVRDIYWDHDGDDVPEWRTVLVCAEGFGGTSIFALDVTDPENWQVLWEATDDPGIGGTAPGGGMGYAFRVALDKVKVPVLDVNDDPIPGQYTVKWMVYVATSFVDIAEQPGGINVFAFDLATGTEQWTFSSTYADSVNDIPGAATTFDIDGDTLADRLYVGDMNGRLWELSLTDDPAEKWTAGHSVHTGEYPDPDNPFRTLTAEIPLFNAGIGNPISVSPAITTRNGHVLLILGTGGTDWAADDKGYHVYAVDATAAGNLVQSDKNENYAALGGAIGAVWSLATDIGEKVWSSPTISAGQIWLVTSSGTMESADPKNDKAGDSKLRLLDLDTGQNVWNQPLQLGKVRGSLFVSRKHVYLTTFDGDIIQLGDQDDFSGGTGNRVVLKSWLHQ